MAADLWIEKLGLKGSAIVCDGGDPEGSERWREEEDGWICP